ncbi:HlyD family secretion protein [Hassallia byssoidea VB512170]|uniref:HlyD family secretion protein n=1 Tax=Hassallia byssoidea VB512170 TaxID=1304833 RepID=A0A846HBN3_9CYAN|nr:HlyD family secretion protein [Hassalia byssoidea]NEU73980.1 HlyD family secretion protein [Hassalia byssoidea VB512170]
MERLESSKQTEQITQMDAQKTSVSEHEVTAIAPIESPKNEKPASRPRNRKLLPLLIVGATLGAGAIAGGIYAYRYMQFAKYHQVTDNAYVSADIYPVNSRIAGVVMAVASKDNQSVKPGEVLVQLDPREYQVSLAQAKADLELAKQQAEVARQNINNVVAIDTPTVRPPAGNPAAQAKIAASRSQSINQQVELNRQQYKTAQAAIAQKQAQLKQAELQLSYTKITAMLGGQVGNKEVRVGQQVQPGQTLMSVVQPNPWVVANFKETQLEKIRPGQKAEIKIAAFPSRKFIGKVDSISPASFSRFAPTPQNSPSANSNNNTVQRVPVKIMLEPESIRGYESRIGPGISADVTVETR